MKSRGCELSDCVLHALKVGITHVTLRDRRVRADLLAIDVERHSAASCTDRQPVPAILERSHVKCRVPEAGAANVVVRAEARLVRVNDDLVVASRAAGEGVPGTGARDRGLEVAVDGPGAVGVDAAVAEACGVAAAAEEHAVLGAAGSLNDARATGGGAGVACGAAEDDIAAVVNIDRDNNIWWA